MSLESLHWCYVWSIMLTSCEPPCCVPPESKKSPLNTYQPELHSHSFHCREISVDRFLCCLQRVANWLRNNSGCFCETLKANSLLHMFGTGKSPVSLNYFKAVFLSYRILAQVIQSVKKKDGDLVEQNLLCWAETWELDPGISGLLGWVWRTESVASAQMPPPLPLL